MPDLQLGSRNAGFFVRTNYITAMCALSRNYSTNLTQLKSEAELWWPDEIKKEVAKRSPAEALTSTYDTFREITTDSDSVGELVRRFEESDEGPINLFLKHIVVFLDVGGEPLSRIYSNRDDLFPNGILNVEYEGNQKTIDLDYDRSTTNQNLAITGSSIAESISEGEPIRDGGNVSEGDIKKAIKMCCYGAYASRDQQSEMQNLDFIDYVGNEDVFDSFVEARYIQVSRITTGGEANASGQVMQEYVRDELKKELNQYSNIEVEKDVRNTIGNESYDSDIAVKNTSSGKCVFIEVSFQVTTNSTIERKRGEAPERYNAFSPHGHYSVYVVDGTGSLHDRPNAVRQIISNSHYVTTCSDQGLSKLARFTEDALT